MPGWARIESLLHLIDLRYPTGGWVKMDLADLRGFDIEADLSPLTNLQSSGQNHQPTTDPISHVQFSAGPLEDPFATSSPSPQRQEQQHRQPPLHLVETLNGDSNKKVFFITNCGSLLGRTIAQVALERGHSVAACAREKHLADLNVHRRSLEGVLIG